MRVQISLSPVIYMKDKDMKNQIRYCEDIGMKTMDRGKQSCKYATVYCRAKCYNNKIYKYNKNMIQRDKKNEFFWEQLNGDSFKKIIAKSRKPVKRFRFTSRGEAIASSYDLMKVFDIAVNNQDIDFWLPTRAWRDEELNKRMIELLFPLQNIYPIASLDPSNTTEEVNSLVDDGWSTIFFGNDTKPIVSDSFKCPKTWFHDKGHCAVGTQGCFSSEQVHVWLKEH